MSSADDKDSESSAAPIIDAECSNCRYWVLQDIPLPGDGICRRFPPSINDVEPGTYAALSTFPITSEDEWCGEHKPSENDSHE